MHEHSVETTFPACARTFDHAAAFASEVLLAVVVFGVVDEDFDDEFEVVTDFVVVDGVVDADVDFVVVTAPRFDTAVLHFTGYADVQKAWATG